MTAKVRGSLILLVVTAGCPKDPAQKGDAATGQPTSGADSAPGTTIVGVSDAAPPPPQRPPDAQATPPLAIAFPDPPAVSCTGDAGEQGGCDFPQPACAQIEIDDAGTLHGRDWLVYYDNPRCVAGQCVYDPLYYQCVSTFCSNGGCRSNFTAVAAP